MKFRIFVLQAFIFIMIAVTVINLFYFEPTASYLGGLLPFVLLALFAYQYLKKLKKEKLTGEASTSQSRVSS